MYKKDFSDLENQIRDSIKNTFDSIDFTGIKEDITRKAESTFNQAKVNIKNNTVNINEKIESKAKKGKQKVTEKIKKYKENKPKYICKRPAGSISGILYMVFGISFSILFGILMLLGSLITSLLSEYYIGTGIVFGILGSFLGGSLILTLRGVSLRKRANRFKNYVSFLGERTYCSIKELADNIGQKQQFVAKDLNKMIENRMFLEAHVDKEKAYFMLTDEVYDDYLKSQESLRIRKEEEAKKQRELEQMKNDPEKMQLINTIEEGQNYIKAIKIANDAIPGEEISNKLYRLEKIVSEIFKYIAKNPKKLSEVSKFTNHYLPITLKLVTAYKELDGQPVQGDNIKTAKNEIENTLDMINVAFEKLLDDLFEDIALDISTDISVLETLFTQEGLTKDDFKK